MDRVKSRKDPNAELLCLLPVESGCITLQAYHCVQCSFSIQSFYRGFITKAQLTESLVTCFSSISSPSLRVEIRLSQCPKPLILWLVFLVTSPHAGSSQILAYTQVWSMGLMNNKGIHSSYCGNSKDLEHLHQEAETKANQINSLLQ